MKVTKYAIVIGAAIAAGSAHAQFGAVHKSDIDMSGKMQGVYLNYSPFARYSASGGGSTNGYILSAEKGISEGKFGPNILGGFFSRAGGSNLYMIDYKMYIADDASVMFGVLGGDNFNGKNDFAAMYFKELPMQENNPLKMSVGAGGYYDSSSSNLNITAALKLSYPIQNGFSIDGSFWYLHQGGNSGNLISLGIGYRL